MSDLTPTLTTRSRLASYLLAVAVVLLAVIIRLLLDSMLGDRMVFSLLFAAVGLVAWFGGRGPALLAVAVGALVTDYFVLAPRHTWAIGSADYVGGMMVYLAVSGLLIGLIEVMRRTQRRAEEASQALALQQEWLRTTLASIGDGVLATDRDGKITMLNAVAERLTGWTSEAASGRPLTDVFRIINEFSRSPSENPVQRAMSNGQIVALANHTLLIGRDGTERAIEDSAAPIRDARAGIIGAVLVFRDATEQRRAFATQQVTSQRLALALQAGRMGAWEWDIVNDKVWWSGNLAALHGIEDGAFGGTVAAFLDMVHVDDRDRVQQALDDAVTGRGEYELEFRRVHPDGTLRWTGTVARVFRDESGRAVRLTGISMDVTERRRIQTELKDADRRKDEFLATLAHELRNPLAPISNGIELMRIAPGDVAVMTRAHDMMQRQLGHMVRLVDDLLDVSRITRNKLELRRQRIALDEVLQAAIETSRPLLEGREFRVSIPTQSLYLLGDLTRLAQVFSNLLNNAAKYTEPGDRIWLEAVREGSDVVVTVGDSGIGIAAEDCERLFELFAQVAPPNDRTQAGLGIGLALARRLVEMHDGTISVDSAGPGHGCEFVVRLPLMVIEPAADMAPAPASAVESAPVRSIRILVVDDNRDAVESLSQLLRRMGHDVRSAGDGEAALMVAADFGPEIVLLDIGMPKMNGYEAARRLRDDPRTRKAVLVAVTGWGQAGDRQAALDAGFDHHLVKPLDRTQLQSLLTTGPARL
jgi:PAS domain S-box-containing protein